MTTFTDQVRETVSPGKFGSDRTAAALYLLSLDSGEDEQTGSVEWDLWLARFGRRLLFENGQGFVSVETFDTEDEARARFARVEAAYSLWEETGPTEGWGER